MSKSVDAQLSQIHFPSTCVVCMSPSSKEYKLEKIFSYGRTSYTVHMNVPMCEPHFEAASFKSPGEKFMGTLAVIAGILGGLFAAFMIFTRWVGAGNLLFKLFAAAFLAFGFFLLIWWVLSSSLVPLFATRESKEARNAVRITRYWPKDQFVQLSFENEQLAEIVQKLN